MRSISGDDAATSTKRSVGTPVVPDVQAVRIWRALAHEVRELMFKHRGRQVSDPYPAEVRVARRMLDVAITAVGVGQRDAEFASTQHEIQHLPIDDCVAEQQTDEARAIRRRPPEDLRP